MLWQIVAPHFVAGIVLGRAPDHIGVQAAPIIRYMKGWTFNKIHDYCGRKGWRMQVVRA